MRKLYIVDLTPEEREMLKQLVSSGKSNAQQLSRARILLKADIGAPEGGWTDEQIMRGLDVGRVTVERVRKSFVENGLEATLKPKRPPRLHRRVLDGKQEAQLIQLACSSPPDGRQGWTLRLLASEMVRLEIVDSISHETVRRTLKKTTSSPI
jgi:transposase